MDSNLLPIVYETVFSKTVWAFNTDLRYFAHYYFGQTNMLLPTLLAIIGASVGAYLNYAVGRFLTGLQEQGYTSLSWEKYDLWGKRLGRFMPLIALLSSYHLVGAVVMAAGFLRVSASKTVPFLVAGQALFYGYYYFSI